ncbi:hypothetical protein, partial [Prevotella veroralis]
MTALTLIYNPFECRKVAAKLYFFNQSALSIVRKEAYKGRIDDIYQEQNGVNQIICVTLDRKATTLYTRVFHAI